MLTLFVPDTTAAPELRDILRTLQHMRAATEPDHTPPIPRPGEYTNPGFGGVVSSA